MFAEIRVIMGIYGIEWAMMNETEKKKAVVLLSGGLDSATTLAIAKDAGFACYALTMKYGQRHDIELRAAKRIAKSVGVAELKQAEIDLRMFGHSALTDEIAVPKDRDEAAMTEGIPVTYVPARNTIFLSYALAYAEVVEAYDLFIGVNAVDYSGYPDCRGEYIKAFETMGNLATKAAVEGKQRLTIHTPLIDLPKTEIIRKGLALGLDYGLTHSCYDPSLGGEPCGHCDSCLIRIKAFAAVGMDDPALVNGGGDGDE